MKIVSQTFRHFQIYIYTEDLIKITLEERDEHYELVMHQWCSTKYICKGERDKQKKRREGGEGGIRV
jgi:hypothetical protein